MKSLINGFAKSILALGFVAFAGAAFAEVGPDTLVKTTAEDVLTIIKNDKDIQAGNQTKIFALAEEKILPNFNFDRVSRIVLGKNWNGATKEQQDAFQKEFKTLLIRTYASALSKYKNQTIEYKPLRAQPTDTEVSVKTQINQPGGQPIEVDYSLAKEADGWKVFDIVIEGVSLVTNYRGQFNNEIRQSGMDGLIQKLVEKNKSNASSKS
ncbi:MlaC/ttg2D family ABC transporter substrate-binding protein [Methyloradius palustris]|uniref:Periplasmic transporter n=1 Tax=Methyloradius palustris TaxID=2778876 RepID=A0A8D5G6C3_9PROT|nr:ABC transporter substrate-binding protein [Methyloradius palustris]BCM23977.1 periplasmic transporter [Methyloradius palustris]